MIAENQGEAVERIATCTDSLRGDCQPAANTGATTCERKTRELESETLTRKLRVLAPEREASQEEP